MSNIPYVNAEDVCIAYSTFKNLQKMKPYEGVTKKEVLASLLKRNDSKNWYEKKIQRIFRILEYQDKIKKRARGEYWIPKFLEKHIEYIKSQVRSHEYDKKIVELLIQAYDREIDRLYSKLEEQEHRYEHYIQDFENEIADKEMKTKRLFNTILQL